MAPAGQDVSGRRFFALPLAVCRRKLIAHAPDGGRFPSRLPGAGGGAHAVESTMAEASKAARKGPPGGRGATSGPAGVVITCGECGSKDRVPFQPADGSTVRCRECHQKHQERRAKPTIRERYGTQRLFHITCEACGKVEDVPSRPRFEGPVYCRDCAQTKLGIVLPGVDQTHYFACNQCNARDWMPHAPRTDAPLICRNCRAGIDVARPERIGGELLDGGGGVRRKRPRS